MECHTANHPEHGNLLAAVSNGFECSVRRQSYHQKESNRKGEKSIVDKGGISCKIQRSHGTAEQDGAKQLIFFPESPG